MSDTYGCLIDPACTFRGAWPEVLAHAPEHPLPHPDERARWLAARRTFVGASEVAAVCGLSPWGSALEVWAAKVRGEQRPMSGPARVGLLLEPVLLQDYATRHGVEVSRPATRRHPAAPHLGATPDGEVVGGDTTLQVKVVGHRLAHTWEDGVPQHVFLQVQVEVAVWDRPRAVVIALLGSDLREYTVERDPEIERYAIEIGTAFWRDYVVPQILPAALDAGDRETVARLFPSALQPLAPAPADLVPALRELADAYATESRLLKAAEEARDRTAARLQALIGEREGWSWRGGYVTWKPPKGSPRWKDVAEAALALRYSQEEARAIVQQHTPPTGSRRLNVHVEEE